MKTAHIIHNPSSGDGDHHKKELVSEINKHYRKVHYTSTDEPLWQNFLKKKPDVIFLGGGDGTVHKVAKVLLKAGPMVQRTPIHLLALGTANNIAKTLGLKTKNPELKIKPEDKEVSYDIGRVSGLPDQSFFLESAGFGIFPRLVSEMDKPTNKVDKPEDELQKSLQVLLEIVKNYRAEKAKITADGEKIEGRFLLAEVMNIKYIGPGFELAPQASPGDGFLNLVIIPEESREALEKYVQKMINGNARPQELDSFAISKKVKQVKIQWHGKDVHVDDDPVENSTEEFEIRIEPDALRFL